MRQGAIEQGEVLVGVPVGEKSKQSKTGIGKRTKIGLATLASMAAIESAGAMATELTNNVPMSAETIKADLAWPWNLGKSAIEDIQRLLSKKAPDTFSATAESGVIGKNTLVLLPQTEIDKQFPTAFGKLREDGNKTILTIRQPITEEERAKQEKAGVIIPDVQFEMREDKGTLQLQYPLDLRQSADPNAQITFTKSYGGLELVDRLASASFQEQGYYDTFEFHNVPKGTIIRASIDSFLVTSRTNGLKQDPNKATAGFMDFQAPNGNIYRLLIYGRKGNDIFVFTPLLDAPELTPEQKRKPIGTYGTPVEKGQAFFQTNEKLDQLGFKIIMAIKGSIGKPLNRTAEPNVPTNLEFFLSPDNKIIASK